MAVREGESNEAGKMYEWPHPQKRMVFPHLAALYCQYLSQYVVASGGHFFHLCQDIGWFDIVSPYAANGSFCDSFIVTGKACLEVCFTVLFSNLLSHPFIHNVLDVLWCSLSLRVGGCLVNIEGIFMVEHLLSISLYIEHQCISAVTAVHCKKEAPWTKILSRQDLWV